MNLSKSAATLRSPLWRKERRNKTTRRQQQWRIIEHCSSLWTADGGAARSPARPRSRIFHPPVRSTWTPFLLLLEPTKYWKTSGRNLSRCFPCCPREERFISKAPSRAAKSAMSCVILKRYSGALHLTFPKYVLEKTRSGEEGYRPS